jgi:hypothetical protein
MQSSPPFNFELYILTLQYGDIVSIESIEVSDFYILVDNSSNLCGGMNLWNFDISIRGRAVQRKRSIEGVEVGMVGTAVANNGTLD